MSFDPLAPHYRWMEGVLAGGKLQRCRTACLGSISEPGNVLICGEGNGRFLKAFSRKFPHAEITCVDASAAMLARARRRLEKAGGNLARVEFIHADLLNWTAREAAYELIVTHFFLDCFRPEQVERIVGMLSTAARPRAQWLLADFQVVDAGLKRIRNQAILALLYAFFRITTRLPARQLTKPDPYLAAAGFALKERREIDWGLLHSDRWTRE